MELGNARFSFHTGSHDTTKCHQAVIFHFLKRIWLLLRVFLLNLSGCLQSFSFDILDNHFCIVVSLVPQLWSYTETIPNLLTVSLSRSKNCRREATLINGIGEILRLQCYCAPFPVIVAVAVRKSEVVAGVYLQSRLGGVQSEHATGSLRERRTVSHFGVEIHSKSGTGS
jgi:hypothetical protein